MVYDVRQVDLYRPTGALLASYRIVLERKRSASQDADFIAQALKEARLDHIVPVSELSALQAKVREVDAAALS